MPCFVLLLCKQEQLSKDYGMIKSTESSLHPSLFLTSQFKDANYKHYAHSGKHFEVFSICMPHSTMIETPQSLILGERELMDDKP